MGVCFYINLIIYIPTLSNYQMAYPSDTHNRIIYMVTISLPSHEITITSKIELAVALTDTHTRQTYIATFSSFSQYFCPSFLGLHNLPPEP